jgi:sortase A
MARVQGMTRQHGGAGRVGSRRDESVSEPGGLGRNSPDELVAEIPRAVPDELSAAASTGFHDLVDSEVPPAKAIGRLLLDAQREADAIVSSAHEEAARRLAESELRMTQARVRGRWLLSYMRVQVMAGLDGKDDQLPGSGAVRGEFFLRLDRASEHLGGNASSVSGAIDRRRTEADPTPAPDLTEFASSPPTREAVERSPEPPAALALEPPTVENETAIQDDRQHDAGLTRSSRTLGATRQRWVTWAVWGRNVGLFLLLFCLYQVWGTGLQEARSQDALKDAFIAARAAGRTEKPALAAAPPTSPPPVANTQLGTTLPLQDRQRQLPNEAVAILRVPKIALDKAVVDGTSVEALRKGPGRYHGSAPPGSPGNFSVAGHRTTYGAPFRELDELVVGDVIEVSTVAGDFTYAVSEPPRIVTPDAGEVLADFGDTRLTLTTCHPEYRASQRLVVVATLIEEEVVGPPSGVPAASPTPAGASGGDADTAEVPFAETYDRDNELVADLGLDGSGSAWLSLGGWSVATAFVALALRQQAFKRCLLGYMLGAPVAVFVTLNLFESLNRLLPAGV